MRSMCVPLADPVEPLANFVPFDQEERVVYEKEHAHDIGSVSVLFESRHDHGTEDFVGGIRCEDVCYFHIATLPPFQLYSARSEQVSAQKPRDGNRSAAP